MTREQRARVVLRPLALWAGLMLLVAATIGYALWPGAPLKTGVALAIAAAQVGLIATIGMGLRRAAWLVRLAALAGVAWLSLLYLIAFADYLTR